MLGIVHCPKTLCINTEWFRSPSTPVRTSVGSAKCFKNPCALASPRLRTWHLRHTQVTSGTFESPPTSNTCCSYRCAGTFESPCTSHSMDNIQHIVFWHNHSCIPLEETWTYCWAIKSSWAISGVKSELKANVSETPSVYIIRSMWGMTKSRFYDFNMLGGMFGFLIMAIFGGKILRWIMFPTCVIICLPFYLRVFILFVYQSVLVMPHSY
jgi:hypothetical protein